MSIDNKARTWVHNIAAGFLCVTAAVTLAVAGSYPSPQPKAPQPQAASEYVPPGMHEAQADVDVGPGADEAQLVTSSWAE
jgi:hypothetical protein